MRPDVVDVIVRTGRHNRHLLYDQQGGLPSDDDPTIGYLDAVYAPLAPVIVAALNGLPACQKCGDPVHPDVTHECEAWG